jgi:hypothetical protein
MNFHKWTLLLIITTLTTLSSSGQELKASTDKIQIAFLLDVSGSMDLLILKAKSQFWRLANYIGTSTKNGNKPTVECALITYGFDLDNDFSKILTDFNSDLDSVAMNLHEIEIGGGNEYCWSTINRALDSLTWSDKKDDLKLIIIAGNESFNQEKIDAKKVTNKAKRMSVVINTIYCHTTIDNPISLEWVKAAEQGKGNHTSISLEDSLNMKENLLDAKLIEFNNKLNETYVPFTPSGQSSLNRMILQDKNSRMAGIPFFRERVMFKAGDSFKNPSWDLVDAIHSDSTLLENQELLRGTSFKEMNQLKEFIENKRYSRQTYKEAIKLRYAMIKKYIGENAGDMDLDLAVKQILNKEGRKKNFAFKTDSKETSPNTFIR